MRRTCCAAMLASVALLAGCKVGDVRPPWEESKAKPEPDKVALTPAPATPSPPPPSPDQVARAFSLLNEKFRVEYERVLEERGSRTIQAGRSAAFDALHAGLIRLGMIVEIRDPDLGTLTVAAPAPRPLSADEWQRTVKTDGPMMGAILCPILGPACRHLSFEPDDYVIAINAIVREADAGRTEISLTTRMREIAPRPGVPRRDYPPPTGVRMALDKIWANFDRELAERTRAGARRPQ